MSLYDALQQLVKCGHSSTLKKRRRVRQQKACAKRDGLLPQLKTLSKLALLALARGHRVFGIGKGLFNLGPKWRGLR
jgi:hypothetical protein